MELSKLENSNYIERMWYIELTQNHPWVPGLIMALSVIVLLELAVCLPLIAVCVWRIACRQGANRSEPRSYPERRLSEAEMRRPEKTLADSIARGFPQPSDGAEKYGPK